MVWVFSFKYWLIEDFVGIAMYQFRTYVHYRNWCSWRKFVYLSDLILTLTKPRPLYVHVSLPEHFVCASRQNCNFTCQFELTVNLRIDCFLSCAYWVRLDINVLAVPYLAAKQLVSYNIQYSACVTTVPCGPGTYLESGDGQCHFCLVDHYQNMVAQTACRPCPAGQHTRGEGAFSVHQCEGEVDSDVNTALKGIYWAAIVPLHKHYNCEWYQMRKFKYVLG